LVIIDQQAAHERILFEKYFQRIQNKNVNIQQSLFPQTLSFSASETELINEVLSELHKLGFDIQDFGQNSFIINGTPADLETENLKDVFDGILENYRNNMIAHRIDKQVNIAQSMAKSTSIKIGKQLKQLEMQNIIDELFACECSNITPSGKKIYTTISIENLNKLFN